MIQHFLITNFKLYTLFVIYNFLLFQNVAAQNSKIIKVCIIPNSEIQENSIKYTLINNKDIISKKTYLSVDSCFTFSVANTGRFKLIIESLCCPPIILECQTDTLPSFYLFNPQLKERSIILKEVLVKAGTNRFQQSGDTLVIKTDDVKTRPHAAATALFDKISGLQIGFGGRVSIMGKTVQEITIDGKKIFGGIPSITLNSIRADMIQEMELVQKTLASGQVSSQLNLKLKESRKNGEFGDFSIGYGSLKNYFVGGNFNKISKSGFTSVFITDNTINERGLNSATTDRILFNSFRNSLNSTSIIGLYDNKVNESDVDIQKLNQSLLGINRFINGGINFTRKKSKSEFDGFIIFDRSTQSLTQKQFKKSFFNNNIQQVNDFSFQENNLTNIILNFNGKVQLGSRNTISFTDKISFNPKQNISIDSTNVSLNQNYLDSRLITFKENSVNQWIHDLQASWNFKSKKKGQNTLFYLNLTQQNPKENISFINNLYSQTLISNQNQSIDKKVNITDIHLQVVQSIPIAKQFLFEGRISKVVENLNLYQNSTIFKVNSDNIDTVIYASAKVKNDFKDISAYLLYQKSKLRVITGISYWDWISNRQKDNIYYNTKDAYLRVQLAKIEYKFSLKSSLSLSYNSNPVMPNWNNIVAISDSSNLVNISTGKLSLKPYLQQKFELFSNQTIGKNLILNFNLNYQIYQNYVITENYLDEITGSFSNTYTNSPNNVSSIGLNFSAFKISTQKLSWALFGGLNHLNSYLKTKNDITPLEINILFSTLSLKWKVSNRISINSDWNIQANRTQSSTNWLNSILTKCEIEMGNNWYLNTISKVILAKDLGNNLNSQNFLDLEISKYLFKNNSLKVSMIAKNVFNLKNEIVINQTNNSQFVLYNNVLPQTLLFKLTFYPESWR
jgi:hypothetical protein